MKIDTVNITINQGQSPMVRAFIESLLHMPDPCETEEPPAPVAPVAAAVRQGSTPIIGESFRGGTYAGIARGETGEPDVHIILLDDVPDGKLQWDDAVKWAQGLGDGARLPTRFESALLYANLRDQMTTTDWYWTGTQYDAYYAFNQNFYHGSQDDSSKSYEGRARAVRRFVI